MTSWRLVPATLAAIAICAGAARAADVEAGRKVYNACKTCHVLEAGKKKIGPSLHGVFGRTAGTVDGFNYSPAMKASGIVWDDATMRRYLKNPKEMVKGGRMAFAGIKSDADLDNLIAYLAQATK